MSNTSERLAVVMAARRKWGDIRIALVELNGIWTLRALTGRWELDVSVNPPFAREKTIIYWQGSSFKEARAEVGLK